MAGFARPYSLLPPVVKLLLLGNIAMFGLQLTLGPAVFEWLALWPMETSSQALAGRLEARFLPWQPVTYAFLHGGLLHLALNMYALWLFGTRLENLWGSRPFAFYYLVCIVGAGLVQLIVTTLAASHGQYYPTVGASGGVFGVLLAFGLTFPNEILILAFPPVALKAKWFVLLYGGIELWAGVTGTLEGIAHFAHLGGMAFGYLLLRIWRARPPRRG
jgi:membrane associated rhomboid family serine protease